MTKPSVRIAIVDDDESVRRALGRFLAANSFTIDTFGTAQEFLSSLDIRKPECLILDLHMPDITGLDLQHHLQRSEIRIPTIIITAHNEIGLRERCRAAGAAAYLVKPVNGPTLVSTINAVVQ